MKDCISKNIVICGIKTIPSCEGGIERGVEEVCSRLVAMGYNITIYSRGDSYQEVLYHGFRIIYIPYKNSKYLCYFTHMARVYSHIVKNIHRPILIHIHTPSVNGIWVALLRLRGHSVVVHNHGLEWRASKWPYWFRTIMKMSEVIGVYSASRLICVSNEEKAYFCHKYPIIAEHCEVIPNGIPNTSGSLFSNSLRHFSLHRNEYYIYVGRLVPQKRIEDLIRAYGMSGSNKQLVIVGGASHSDCYAQSLHNLPVSYSDIIFTGWQKHADVLNLLKKSYAFILPSQSEGCPNALLEAISCHCVCIVSDIVPHREIGGDKLTYFSTKNYHKLANILYELDTNSNFYSNAYQSVKSLSKSLSDWDHVSERIACIYNEITLS